MTFRIQYLRSAILPAAILMIAAATPVSAQYRWGPPDAPPPGYGGRIHPQHIEAMVRSMGFQPVAEPRARGPLWITHAVDREGRHVRVVIDSFSGRVIDVLQRPVPPRSVNITPPPNLRTHPDIQNGPRQYPQYPPQAAAPDSDYDDDNGPDYDYRDQPPGPQRPLPQQPQYNPQQQYQPRPNSQQGPNVIPYEPRSNNDRLNNQNKTSTSDAKKNKANAAKKKDKKDDTAALTPEKKNVPTPQARPQEAPQTAQTPKPAPEMKSAPEPATTGAVPAVQPLDPAKKNETPSAAPPVQPLL